MSSFSSLFPVQTSPIKSIQRGYVNSATTAGVGEEASYVDVTITAVDVAKAAISAVGGAGTSTSNAGYYSKHSTNDEAIVFARLTSPTNLRLYAVHSGNDHIRATWQVVEYV